MKLLVFTQAVDKNDPVLGFFEGWLGKFAEKFEEISVVALRVGEYSLPANVKVFSISGLKNRRLRIYKIVCLFFLIWKTRRLGDAVLVHMNKEYVLAGWLVWKLIGTPIYFWYNHKKADFFARLAMKLSKKVFYTSSHSAGAKLPNSVQMPVGVDTGLFKPSTPIGARGPSLLSLGRIDPVKNIDVLANAILLLDNQNPIDFKVTIAGSPSWGSEKYAARVRETLKPLVDRGMARFVGGIPHEDTAELFNQNKIFINLSPPGLFDKTIIEAMACGCLVIAGSQSIDDVIGEEGRVGRIEPAVVAEKIKASFALSSSEFSSRSFINRDFVVKNHSLEMLAMQLEERINLDGHHQDLVKS